MKITLNAPVKPRIVFCLPGNTFSGDFLDSYTDLLGYCYRKGIEFVVSRRYSPVIYYVRNMCLGGDNLRGVDQKPFNGQLDYTHLMWIDSDVIFRPEHFDALLKHDEDIVSGLYMMKGGQFFATVKDWNEEYFKKHGSFQFLTEKDVANHEGLMEVDYTGFGFILIKKHVMESLKYPWFRPLWHQIGSCRDFSSEDASICKLFKEVGHKIHIDPKIRVGHLKETII